jgi:hypothetical protein
MFGQNATGFVLTHTAYTKMSKSGSKHVTNGNQVKFELLKLDPGIHKNIEEGCSPTELISLLAGEPLKYDPPCSSTIVNAFLHGWEDHLGETDLQRLIPILPQFIGSGEDNQDMARISLILDWMDKLVPIITSPQKVPFLNMHLPIWVRKAFQEAARDACLPVNAAVVAVSTAVLQKIIPRKTGKDALALCNNLYYYAITRINTNNIKIPISEATEEDRDNAYKFAQTDLEPLKIRLHDAAYDLLDRMAALRGTEENKQCVA